MIVNKDPLFILERSVLAPPQQLGMEPFVHGKGYGFERTVFGFSGVRREGLPFEIDMIRLHFEGLTAPRSTAQVGARPKLLTARLKPHPVHSEEESFSSHLRKP